MLGREVEDMRVGRITQERAALHAALQGLRAVGDVAPLSDEPADRKAPVGIEVIDHSASIMASATPFCFCTTQKHISVKITMNSIGYNIITPMPS